MSSSSAAPAAPVYQFRPVWGGKHCLACQSHTWHTLTTHSHRKNLSCAWGGVLYAPDMLDPYWFLAVWLDSCCKSKYLALLSSFSFRLRQRESSPPSWQLKLCFLPKDGGSVKTNFTERESFPDQSPYQRMQWKHSFIPQLFFFPWYINPPFRDSWLEEVWVGFMFAINLYGEESGPM